MLATHETKREWPGVWRTLHLPFLGASVICVLLPQMQAAGPDSKNLAERSLVGTNDSGSRSNFTTALRPPVHSRRNVDEFPPVNARFVRFTILKTNRGEPCLDELEIFTANPEPRNVALARAGGKVTASGTLPGYGIHKLEHINDGVYGNGRSWISNEAGKGWVVIELPAVENINKVVWGRDRESKFIDRLVTEYKIEVAEAWGGLETGRIFRGPEAAGNGRGVFWRQSRPAYNCESIRARRYHTRAGRFRIGFRRIHFQCLANGKWATEQHDPSHSANAGWLSLAGHV